MQSLKLYQDSKTMSNYETLLDDDVYELLKDQKIYEMKLFDSRDKTQERVHLATYAQFCNKRITGVQGSILLHRFVMKLHGYNVNEFEIDHINGNRLDNRFENLRVCNHSTNAANRGTNINKKNCKYKNVHKIQGTRWQVKIMKMGKSWGWFSSNSLLECVIFANMLSRELFGEFATQDELTEWNDEEILIAKQAVQHKIFKHNLKHSLKNV